MPPIMQQQSGAGVMKKYDVYWRLERLFAEIHSNHVKEV